MLRLPRKPKTIKRAYSASGMMGAQPSLALLNNKFSFVGFRLHYMKKILSCLCLRLFVLSFFPRDVLDETWDVIESVSEGFLTYSCPYNFSCRSMTKIKINLHKIQSILVKMCCFYRNSHREI